MFTLISDIVRVLAERALMRTHLDNIIVLDVVIVSHKTILAAGAITPIVAIIADLSIIWVS